MCHKTIIDRNFIIRTVSPPTHQPNRTVITLTPTSHNTPLASPRLDLSLSHPRSLFISPLSTLFLGPFVLRLLNASHFLLPVTCAPPPHPRLLHIIPLKTSRQFQQYTHDGYSTLIKIQSLPLIALQVDYQPTYPPSTVNIQALLLTHATY